MRARCKVSFGCGVCFFTFSVVSCFLSGCLFVLDYVFAGFGWGEGGGAVAVTLSPPPHIPYRNYDTHLLPRPDSRVLSKIHG